MSAAPFSVSAMKTLPHSRRPLTFRTETPTTADLAAHISQRHGLVIQKLATMLRHPRSLARPVATWRPVSIALPAVSGHRGLTATLTRHRVGPRAKARIRGYDGEREPAYVISLRITDPAGFAVDTTISDAWISALVGEEHIERIHEVSSGVDGHPTYVWLVDGHFLPVASPASLFAGFSHAA